MDLTQLDVFLPGCSPNANRISTALEPLLCGEIPHLEI